MQVENWYAIATLAAIVVGPILAVLVTRVLDRAGEKRRRKFEVFKSLMQTRGLRLDPVHVAALNVVEIEYYNEKEVRDAFRAYVEHLSAPMPAVEEQPRFFDQRSDLFMNVLSKMGSVLKLQFDKRDLERLSYVPQGWDNDQALQRRNMQLLGQVLGGERAIPVTSILPGPSPYPEPPKLEKPADD